MSLFDEHAFRIVIADELRKIIREELAHAPGHDTYLSVVDAAMVAAVVPDTIRSWIDKGRLGRYHAGRELRIKRNELEAFLAADRPKDREPTPEEEARRFLAHKAARGGG